MNEEELLEYAHTVILERKIESPWGLGKVDVGLYQALLSRKLMDKVDFKKRAKQRSRGFFPKMTNDELVEYANRFLKESNVETPTELKNIDGGLYHVLWERKLLEIIKFEKRMKQRPKNFFSNKSDSELIDYAQKIVNRKKMKGPSVLKKVDGGLYNVLCERGLIKRVFSSINKSKKQFQEQQLQAGLTQAADAMEQFGDQG
jgi:hypothetical protein